MKKTTQYMNLCRVSPKAYFKSVCSLLFTAYCLLICQLTSAQLFPVNVIPQLIPPYSLKLSDYQTTSSEKLIVNLLLTDTGEFGRQVRLKMSIEGQGLNIQTRDFVVGANPISLDGGVNQRLTNLDLRPYFRLNNLLGINPQQYNQPLPDGRYDFCFQVFDRFSGQVLSQKRCAFAYLVLNDPPFLNLPQRGEQIIARDPLNIVFRWTPRHLNAMGVRYEFTLKELWDTGIDPQAAFLASPILHQETTFAPTLLYGPANLPLLPDKTYGWRVRAISSTNGIDENAVYRNNGYSEIFHFRLTKDCKAPKFALSEVLGQDQVKIAWQGDAEHLKYKVQYRKVAYTQETDKQRQRREKRNKKRAERGKEAKPYTPKRINYTWFEVNTRNQGVQIGNLEAGQTYEFRVGGSCNAPTVYHPYYTYSDVREFTIPLVDETSSYQCGVLPEIYISNKKPLQHIGVNEVFTASDFPVTVTQIRPSPLGGWDGAGFVVVPYLGDTRIQVTFSNIQINTDYQLIDGVVQTAYDASWQNVVSVDGLVESIGGLITDLLENFDGSEEQIKELEDLQEQYVSEIEEALNNPDIPKALKETIRNASENSNSSIDDLIESAYRHGKGGPNAEGYEGMSQGASNRVNETDAALEKAYDIAFVTEAQRLLTSGNAEQSFWEIIEKMQEVYEFLEQCHQEGWKSYEDKGIVPYCYWIDREVNPDDILTEKDIPYISGIIDGVYQEGKAIIEIPDMLKQWNKGIHQVFYAYTITYLKCRESKITANKERFEALLKKLKIEKKQSGLWNWFKKKWNNYKGEKEEVEAYLRECEQAEKTRQAINDMYELANSWEDIKNLYAIIASKIDELYAVFNTKSSINEERYKKGILDTQILSITVPIVGQLGKAKKVEGFLKSLKNLTQKQWDDLAKQYGDELSRRSGGKRLVGDLANGVGRFKHVDEFLEAIPTSPRNFRDEVINAFDGAKELKYSDGEKLFYRRWGGGGKESGSWLSTEQLSVDEAKRLLALPNNNTAQNLTVFKLKKGTPYIEGKVASQVDNLESFGSYATGGGNQIYILYEDVVNLVKVP